MAKTDVPSWSDRVAAFIDDLEELQRSEHTRRNYRDDLLVFAAWYRDTHDGEEPQLDTLTKRTILDWKKRIEDTGGRKDKDGNATKGSMPTVNRKVAAINAFLRWAVERELAPRSSPVKPNKTQRAKEPKSLEADARRALLREVLDARNLQHILIFRLGLDGGLRVSEMAALEWADIKVTDRKGHMTVKGKGNKTRSVPMTPALRQAFLDAGWSRHKGQGLAVLQGRSKRLSIRGIQDIAERYGRITRVGKRIGLEGFSIHSLRHSCADRLLNEEGLSITEVAEILGHADVKTTMLYLRPHAGKLSDRMAAIQDDD
jgi:integrase